MVLEPYCVELEGTERIECSERNSVSNSKEEPSSHMVLNHESLNVSDDFADIDLGIGETFTATASVEERNCPTPIPESIFICAECNCGFKTQEEIDVHIKCCHEQVLLEEKLKRAESELRYEKSQHDDHLKMLEENLMLVSSLTKQIEDLEKIKRIEKKSCTNWLPTEK